MPRPRPARCHDLCALLLGCVLLVGCGPPAAPALQPLSVEVEVLDVLEAFARGEARVLAADPEHPLALYPPLFAGDALLASDQDREVLRARAPSAFEIDTGPLARGARLAARTLVHSGFRDDPARADPHPVTFRILVEGELQASLRSDYILEPRLHPYDRVLRTLDVDLGPWAGRPVTLRFETIREGAEPPEQAELPEPVWWELELRQPVDVPRQVAGPDAPNLLVLCVDTLAAGRTSVYGHTRRTTPRLDAFARRGTVFETATAMSSWTLPAVASLLTGLAPNTHGVLGDTRSYLMEGLATWPELLRREGLEGAAFVSNPLLARANNFQQGFGTWESLPQPAEGHFADAAQIDARFLAWLDGQPVGGRWFAYVHYMEPHAPYDAPPGHRERFTQGYVEQQDFGGHLPARLQQGELELDAAGRRHVGALYDGEVAYSDESLGRLLDALEQRGLLEATVVIVTADHGEELFEHDRLGHGYALHEEMLRVPLVCVGPGFPAGRRVPEPVSTAALYNTLLQLGGADPLPGAAPPLLPLADIARRGAAVFATTRTHLFGPDRTLVSARDPSGRKVVLDLAAGEWEAWRLGARPEQAERVDPATLPAHEREAYEQLRDAARRWHDETAAERPVEPQPSADIEQALEALGYVQKPGR